ncbi:hypothetical protein ACJJTC_006032 [Scirpophaga incertulas]
MSISTATDERTEGDDDTSQGSQPKDESSDSENENEPQSQNGGSPSPEVHEITSDDDDDGGESNDEDSSNSSTESNDSSEGSQQSHKAIEEKKMEDQLENGEDESDVEEVSMEDPLTQNQIKSKPVVVNDSKSLADLASKQPKSNGDQNKEPTVVIIDTNSILSGKGPQPVQTKAQMSTSAIDAQNLCQSIAARGTTITPVSSKNTPNSSSQNNAPIAQPQPNILPSLTDDMFVVEAPSFIVPYVYEKPSLKPFREFVDKLGKELEEIKIKEEKEKYEKERLEKEQKEKERRQRIERGEDVSEEVSDKEMKHIENQGLKEKKSEKKRRKRDNAEDDDSWDGESSTETEDEAGSDEDAVQIIKEKDDMIDEIKDPISMMVKGLSGGKSDSYFDCSLGQFFINIGLNLVQEFVQSDLLKHQNRKLYKEKKSGRSTRGTEAAIASLTQNLEFSKRTNAPYTLKQKRCEFCSFKTESMLVMAHHLEAPHMRNNIYKCNTCPFEIRSPHDILFHMEAEHNIRGRLERAPAYQQCASCHFEDNSKTKLARHLIACAKKFKPEFNLSPPLEWEPPAKIPKLSRARNNAVAPYQNTFSRAHVGVNNLGRPPLNVSNVISGMPVLGRPRGRPPMVPPRPSTVSGVPIIRSGLMIMHNNSPSGTSISNYPILQHSQANNATPKISITPLPRTPQPSSSQSSQNSKATFVICEICDGYIKDLEQLRNHMQWIHKVKIHPKMIYNRPPLNCQKCQFRFFTDQGLERHLLGSHGLVTSSMQEAANKGKDAGRCPVCGRVYQWKLLNHVSRDHNMTLKPAHLSYKCTVCTATFVKTWFLIYYE